MAKSEYEAYIRTDELLALQKPESELNNPDEILFQVTHQAMELWLKALAHDIRRIPTLVEEGKLHRAAHLLRRGAEMIGICNAQLHVLENMDPADYHPIRLGLGRGSGQDSPGFNWILDHAREILWPAFEGARKARGVEVLDLMRTPDRHYDLYQLMQGLLELDTTFQKFRYLHYSLVRRIIGSEVRSLKGIPASQLIHGATECLFPELWEAVNALTREFKPEY
ncbi:MAG: tryptophan 2,3-dioxygenase [Deltaproteobacteria bacterium]|nr:MAG: tryptophan 2,3-dioxygenase [Deltaproteobacteria bacterium]